MTDTEITANEKAAQEDSPRGVNAERGSFTPLPASLTASRVRELTD